MRNFQAIAFGFVMLAVAAHAEPGALSVQTIDQLKTTYLDCDRRASVAMLDFGDAANCSMAHEELRQRGFGGDWNRMFAWWKSQRVAVKEKHRREADVSIRVAPMDPGASQ